VAPFQDFLFWGRRRKWKKARVYGIRNPIRGSGGASWAPPVGFGAKPQVYKFSTTTLRNSEWGTFFRQRRHMQCTSHITIVTIVTILNYTKSAVGVPVKLLPPCLILLLPDYFGFTLPLNKVLPIHSPLGPAEVPSLSRKTAINAVLFLTTKRLTIIS